MSVKVISDGFEKLRSAIKKGLSAEKVLFEAVPGSRRFRVIVIASKFKRVPPLTRQDRVWAIVNTVISPAASLRICLIFAYTPEEIKV